MYRLFLFLRQYRAFLVFALLETVSIWLIVQNNSYQGAAFFNSANRYAGSVLHAKSNVQNYFNLKQENEVLALDNARLKQLIAHQQEFKGKDTVTKADSNRAERFEFFSARVINNSTALFNNNYLTIDRGTLDGLSKGMGVISTDGVVGRIKDCSNHYCTVFSILNNSITISGKLKNKGIECNIKWEGKNPHEVSLLNVTRNQKLNIGDTVVTSGYNPFFPEGILIGKIKSVQEEEGGSYWKASVDLSTDFTSLNYVYVIGNRLEAEQDSLENATTKPKP